MKIESGFNYGLHETFGGFSRPFHSSSNRAENKVTQSKHQMQHYENEFQITLNVPEENCKMRFVIMREN